MLTSAQTQSFSLFHDSYQSGERSSDTGQPGYLLKGQQATAVTWNIDDSPVFRTIHESDDDDEADNHRSACNVTGAYCTRALLRSFQYHRASCPLVGRYEADQIARSPDPALHPASYGDATLYRHFIVRPTKPA
ncbi:hypothetical protein ETB97_004666 [Aspergillus alliaceus]|uniref:Uncharacterized protein n=1 Tax=Petromyces alliaceus TaxID=209559 RepID=A0A8H6E3M8_PETAA|nr:hypothetical protein ETB97_004666 [Aspergillus burnettii]